MPDNVLEVKLIVLFVNVSVPVRVVYVLVSSAQELAAVFFKNPLVPVSAAMAVKSASLDCRLSTEVYNSSKLSLIFPNAVRNGSPLPLLADVPMLTVFLAILSTYRNLNHTHLV